MLEKLAGYEPLTQVWFVLDYIQLQFQDCTLSIFNVPWLQTESGQKITRGDAGFCDRLVGLIEQDVIKSDLIEGQCLCLTFNSGTKLVVPIVQGSTSNPEALEVAGGPIGLNAVVFNL